MPLVGATAASGADAKAIFVSLCEKFRIDVKIAAFLVEDAGCERLEDFGALLTDENQVEARITEKITGLDRSVLQASRVRQAWHAVRAAMESAKKEAEKPASAEDDLETLLPKPQLDKLGDFFWNRYHMFFGVSIEPSDYLVSTLKKEIDRRTLVMHDVFKSKTMLVHQKMARRRERLSARVELVEVEQEPDQAPVTQSLYTYISLHLTLMIGYAKAGAAPLEGAPVAPETKESDSTEYVVCPLDTLLAYHYRMVDRARRLPYMSALNWIQTKDEADRAEWIERLRRTSLPLGRIIKQVTESRQAL